MNNILFIDDEPHILHSMKLAFRDENLKLFLVDNPLKALEIVREKEISVVVSDNFMPGLNGVELLSKVRKISPLSIRILLTGQCDEDCMIKSINTANIFKFIPKPFSASSIVLLVQNSIQVYKESKLIGKLKKGNINLVQAIQRHSINDMNFGCKLLHKNDLKVGMTLMDDLKNTRGILLMRKGKCLNPKDLDLIRSNELPYKIAISE